MINGSNNTETILDTNVDIHITGNVCSDINCIDELINHIKEKKRKLNLYRKILELKYNRYKKCHNAWSISTILLSTCLTLIESCKLIFIDKDDKINREIYDLSPIFIGSIITCTSSILKFKKYQEKMELLNNVIQNCVGMVGRLKIKKEVIQLQKNCYDEKLLKDIINAYNDEILQEYCIIYQESQKYIKSTDYDKYAKQINYSELYKHMIEQERQEFYQHYKEHKPKIVLEEVMKKTSEKGKLNNKCFC